MDYFESVIGFARLSFVDVDDAFAEVVLSSLTIVDAFELQDRLTDVLSHFGSASTKEYLLKPRNLALTQSRTCLPTLALAIFLFLGAATASDIWQLINQYYI